MNAPRQKPGPKAHGGKKKIVAISISDDTKRMLHELAAADGVSASTWIARAVLFAAMRAEKEAMPRVDD